LPFVTFPNSLTSFGSPLTRRTRHRCSIASPHRFKRVSLSAFSATLMMQSGLPGANCIGSLGLSRFSYPFWAPPASKCATNVRNGSLLIRSYQIGCWTDVALTIVELNCRPPAAGSKSPPERGKRRVYAHTSPDYDRRCRRRIDRDAPGAARNAPFGASDERGQKIAGPAPCLPNRPDCGRSRPGAGA